MNYQSTKFLQTSAVLIGAFALAWADIVEGTAYVTVTLGALANYAYHDVKQKGL